MKKKIFAFGLAMTMVMGMSMTAFADYADYDAEQAGLAGNTSAGSSVTMENALEMSSQVEQPVLKITLPATPSKIILNPYRTEYEVSAAVVGSGTDENPETPAVTSTDSVISKAMEIQNASKVPVQVNVESFYVTLDDGVDAKLKTTKLATAALAKTDTTNSVFLYLATGKDATEAAAKYNAKTMLVPGTAEKTAAKMTGIMTIDKATDATHPGSGYIKINGEAVNNPATPWSANNKIDVSLKFSFYAVANTVN
ncbi:MAG: hypothetical protein IJ833_01305 [Lachnospiraceae bacterium]|nr:hypothetical protein [Lachnospiraceae bacterium]